MPSCELRSKPSSEPGRIGDFLIDRFRLETLSKTMLVHNVFFWLRPELSETQIAEFRSGLESLQSIEAAEAVYIGTPAAVADRPVLETSYSFCLTVLLSDVGAHDAYQADPVHQNFIARFKGSWEKVQVYDAD
jgi:Stress responsive A/B Barrel Domain.